MTKNVSRTQRVCLFHSGVSANLLLSTLPVITMIAACLEGGFGNKLVGPG